MLVARVRTRKQILHLGRLEHNRVEDFGSKLIRALFVDLFVLERVRYKRLDKPVGRYRKLRVLGGRYGRKVGNAEQSANARRRLIAIELVQQKRGLRIR